MRHKNKILGIFGTHARAAHSASTHIFSCNHDVRNSVFGSAFASEEGKILKLCFFYTITKSHWAIHVRVLNIFFPLRVFFFASISCFHVEAFVISLPAACYKSLFLWRRWFSLLCLVVRGN